MKKIIQNISILFFAILMSTFSFAGQLGQNEKGFYYVQDDGTLATSKWINADFAGEGKSSSYYFDENSFMLMNTTTPDGYFVGVDGKWDGNSLSISNSTSVIISPNNENSNSVISNTKKSTAKYANNDDEEDDAGGGMVWISKTGKRYHSTPHCGNIDFDAAREVSESWCKKKKMKKCKNCW